MMTEEEMRAWDGVTPEAAQYVVDTVTKAAGETLLRGALRRLMGFDGGNERYRDALVFQALMAARDAGIRAGIRVMEGYGYNPYPLAVIHLPTGIVAFTLSIDMGMEEMPIDGAGLDAIRRYIGE
jgi:hypothetical protein